MCHICGQMFKTQIVQRRHIQTIHNNPNKYNCGTCKRAVSSRYALKRHERLHDDYNVGIALVDLENKILEGEERFDQPVITEGDDMNTEDENLTAIETITVKGDNLGQLEQIQSAMTLNGGNAGETLSSETSQIQTTADVEQTFIQGKLLEQC